MLQNGGKYLLKFKSGVNQIRSRCSYFFFVHLKTFAIKLETGIASITVLLIHFSKLGLYRLFLCPPNILYVLIFTYSGGTGAMLRFDFCFLFASFPAF